MSIKVHHFSEYTVAEGGDWYNGKRAFTQEQLSNLRTIQSAITPQAFIKIYGFHALRKSNGHTWDAINGWRT